MQADISWKWKNGPACLDKLLNNESNRFAMNSPLGLLFTDRFMGNLEDKVLRSISERFHLHKGYMDVMV